MITFNVTGNFDKTEKFLNKLNHRDYMKILDKYGNIGVQALSNATPIDSGKTASSWSYEIHSDGIYWTNSNINRNVNIAIILQYGHGTRTGGYVQGRDYINPAMRPVFDNLANALWKEVTSV